MQSVAMLSVVAPIQTAYNGSALSCNGQLCATQHLA
jgi:hypothetical protein